LADGTFNYGGLSFPLATPSATTLLQDADPAIFWALDYFSTMLATHIGARLVAESTACGATDITAAVRSTVPYDPAPLLTTQQLKLPMLAVYRIRDRYQRITSAWSHEEATWGVTYVLPPLRDDQVERLWPILHAAAIVIHNRTEQGHDPAYRSNALVWADLARVERIGVTGGSFGRYDVTDQLYMPAWTGEIVCREREMPPTDLPALAGTDDAIDLAQSGAATIPDLVNIRT
jgi:hypothetical protein